MFRIMFHIVVQKLFCFSMVKTKPKRLDKESVRDDRLLGQNRGKWEAEASEPHG